jgi:hypothetical protein
MATRAAKRAAADQTNPLQDPGLLQHILDYVGAGQCLFVSVSHAWKLSYQRVEGYQLLTSAEDGSNRDVWVTPRMTLLSHVVASAALVRLSHACGARLRGRLAGIYAGKYGDMQAIEAACELGMIVNDDMLRGAALSGCLPKLQKLYYERKVPEYRGIELLQ